ncbi:MAG: TonB family protein, partial [Opitutaceae bacterium]
DGGQSNFALPLHPLARIIGQPKIKYPVQMRYAGIIGTVEIAVSVEETGAVTQAKTLKASMSEFIPAAEKFARSCTFIPRVIDGKAAGFECIVAVKFALKDQQP